MASKEGVAIYSKIIFDYKNGRMYADATGKNGKIEGSLKDDFPFFSGAKSEVFSKRLIDVIVDLNLEGIDIYPITLTLPDGAINQDWYNVSVYPHVDCIDFGSSTLKLYEDGSIRRIKYLVLDTKKAQQAGYDIFRLHDEFPRIIVSDRFKEAIEAVNTKDICFFPTDGSEYK